MAKATDVTIDQIPQSAASHRLLRWLRFWVGVEMFGLFVSGVTAFPLREELRFIADVLPNTPLVGVPGLDDWVQRVADGLDVTAAAYPWLAYGTDWLAFAHLGIALAFVGVLRDPIRNVWVTRWGVWLCLGIIPLAVIAGPLRGLPWGWTLVDLSFCAFGIIPLLIALRLTRRLEALGSPTPPA